MMTKALCICIVCFLATMHPAFGQGTPNADDIKQLREELSRLRTQVDSLKSLQQDTQTSQDDQLESIEETLDKRLSELEKKIDAVARTSSTTALNPKLTAFINVAARMDSKDELDYSGSSQINNRLFLRTFELEFNNAVDPYASAVAIFSVEDEAGTGYSADPEEVYGLIKRLPILEEAPLGLKLKLGKFRAPFGVSNKTHMHDIPWVTRPLAVTRYLGTEHGDFFESGYNPVGMDFDFLIPTSSFTTELNLDLVRGGEIALANSDNSKPTAFLGHINFSNDWNNEHLLNLGLSFYGEGNFLSKKTLMDPSHHTLFGADVTYKWAPAERRTETSIVMGGEAFFADYGMLDSVSNAVFNDPSGWYGYIQYQTSYWLYLGARFDWIQEPVLAKPVTKAFAAYASYYTTEFLRLRIGYEHRWSELPQFDDLNSLMFDVNFVFGSHPTEPYWVNR